MGKVLFFYNKIDFATGWLSTIYDNNYTNTAEGLYFIYKGRLIPFKLTIPIEYSEFEGQNVSFAITISHANDILVNKKIGYKPIELFPTSIKY